VQPPFRPPFRYTLKLAKSDFKFSVAHFTLFGPVYAEPLHGHNYRVAVEVAGAELEDEGLLIETGVLKRRVRELCEELDDRVLLPELSPYLQFEAEEGSLECRYAERVYRFPEREVLLLPVVNVTMEQLATLLWRRLADDLAAPGILHLAVEVEETDGQSVRVEAPLSRG
jgi:6-pyruvoyltetrahydropterin/6-carboxytetrahydropterin synthase